jgi:hypothetical protein
MDNCDNDFENSSLVVQQTKIYYDVMTDTGVTATWNDIDTSSRPSVEDLKELWYNDGVQL